MFRKLIVTAGVALAIGVGAGSAHAVTHVTVTNGVFDDGGTFSGWFDFGGPFTVTGWDLVTTAGATLPGDEYKSGGAGQAYDLTFFPAIDFTHDTGGAAPNDLSLLPYGPGALAAFESSDAGTRIGLGDYQISGAPEPGVWIMSILGFGLTGAALRRRKLALA